MGGSLLYVTQVAPYLDGPAGVHGVLGQSATAVSQLAETAGLVGRAVTDVRSLAADELGGARVLALFTIGETPWSADQQAALLSRVRAGTLSILGIHAATDSCYGWADYCSLTGARFDGHPWTKDIDIEVADPAHPAVAHLGTRWSWHDEVYRFRDLRPDARVLLRAPLSQLPGAEPAPSFGYPLSWCFTEGAGRVFYTALGHFPAAWESVAFLRHLLGGLAWLLE